MNAHSQENERWITARHEAGHAVAGLHYNCPIVFTSIEPDGHTLGTTRMRLEEPQDAIVVFCGLLAEKNWEEYVPGSMSPIIETVGPDQEALQILAHQYGDLGVCFQEALLFMSQRPVQQQIDRVASALLERTRLTVDEVSEVAGFSHRLCSATWQ